MFRVNIDDSADLISNVTTSVISLVRNADREDSQREFEHFFRLRPPVQAINELLQWRQRYFVENIAQRPNCFRILECRVGRWFGVGIKLLTNFKSSSVLYLSKLALIANCINDPMASWTVWALSTKSNGDSSGNGSISDASSPPSSSTLVHAGTSLTGSGIGWFVIVQRWRELRSESDEVEELDRVATLVATSRMCMRRRRLR